MSDHISEYDIFWAIILTIAFGTIFGALCYHPKSDVYDYISTLNFPSIWITVPIYLILHPLIGKVICEVTCMLCWGIDKVYGLPDNKKWGEWSKGQKILFASSWPVTGPFFLTITFLALVYGILFKSLFK